VSNKSERDGIAEKWTIIVVGTIQVSVGRSLQEPRKDDEA